MGLKALTDNYAAYNLWSGTKMIEWLQQLPPKLLYRETPSSFPSIDATVQHMLRTQRYWLLFITGAQYQDFDWSVRPDQAEQILAELQEHSILFNAKLQAFSEDELSALLDLDAPWSRNKRSRFDYILHAINHNTYHRGQVVTIAHCIGITDGIPNTDYNMFNTR